ncbi:polysaccharide deacetylase family sporulation protein PdaB [Oceanirhabdus sp. W0125-5]|uniref:polysaccharide deacetylase family sporulation protein PdaB n=1 Tax=Oceanirhabdus sp. W0125-5 TaxID=2999116 RepID=UPI0022F2E887|nr:polysaccharide deacetylase family sporulation protein PdaB [Oceanirhabdus sp. W0125-5]WBW99375.1 polysaccharide deacetylase family sporulation protein PdaB [Oceanirhabdus sp. W0125-5]
MDLKKIKFNINIKIIIFSAIIIFVGALMLNKSFINVLNLNNKKLPIYNVETNGEKVIAITFDASWGADNTIKILDVLDEYDVKGTFFLVGRWVDEYNAEVEEIHKRGHEIGNHSNSHPNMTSLSKDAIIREIITTDNKIRQITGEGTKIFRFPEGAYNDKVIEIVEESGHYCIQWDVDSIDWKEQGAEKEYERVISKTKGGSIILFHNNAKYTPENLPRILKQLKNDGFSFVTVSELIYKEDYIIDHAGKQIKK